MNSSTVQKPRATSVEGKGKGSLTKPPTPQSQELVPSASTVPTKPDLITAFKSDLTNIKSLVTCSICDQLLYEPWTLSCGHTYCYSCLCSWFVPNKRKKTCPECRTRIKQIPAPSFLVKQLVEIFIKREELMPLDETNEQHAKRRAKEVAEVEQDKSNPAGLFKGTFSNPLGELYRDDADGGVMRCRNCNAEHEGGPACQYCGTELDDEGYDFSDEDVDFYDGADLDELDSLDLENEIHADLAAVHGQGFAWTGFVHPYVDRHARHDDETESSLTSDEDEDGGSLDGFIDNDDDEEEEQEDDEEPVRAAVRRSNHRSNQQANVIEISDDEDDDSDEGGIVSNRVARNRPIVLGSSSPAAPSVVSVVDTDTTDSDGGETNSEMLRRSGWSPLDQGTDSDADEHQFQFRAGYEFNEDEPDSEDNSDTETMVGNGASDDEEDDRSRSSLSETPTMYAGYQSYMPNQNLIHNYSNSSASEDADDDDSVAGFSSVRDQDGDTEMSVSPRASRSVSISHEHSVSVGDSEDEEPRTSRSMSRTTDQSGYSMQELGAANEIHDIGDDSDSPIRPPPRRLPRRRNPNAREYDPRISMIFAEHQQTMRSERGQEPGGLDELDNEVRRIEPASRSRRMTAYRQQPQRRFDPLRASRSPSATRVVASSSRTSRPPRNYQYGRANS
ncbi:hypothetical protein HYFRA_00002637 [Hymenoscyphus fraxineus]|uniref:RING-type domain-containing protein n=1 Tax=Hymenoscyphus fraxineus TaxID=746836 RepID=A0A9N9L7W0_9HELO|nr:hypothetical protein HYFRA_00002637 [Hymenoscyphus fraxineus]